MTRILLVDDEPDILDSTAELLRLSGYEVATENRADCILEAVRRERPDVVLQDVRMPGMDLPAVVHAMKTDASIGEVPIILFSATVVAAQVAEQVGADDSLEKPFLPDRLLALLRKWSPSG